MNSSTRKAAFAHCEVPVMGMLKSKSAGAILGRLSRSVGVVRLKIEVLR